MSEETAAETKYCSNCKKDIAASNFTMHEVHCRRHLVLCEHCREPVPRTEVEKHFNDIHAKVPCAQCKEEMEKDHMDAHLESECAKRQVSCEYCELHLPHCDLASHLEFCGTRTEACPQCGNFIMHKDLQQHNTTNCAFPEPARPPLSPRQRRGVRANPSHNMGVFPFEQQGNFFSYGNLDESFDPFLFEEIHWAMEEVSDDRRMLHSLEEDSDASAASAAPVVEERIGRRHDAGGGERGRREEQRRNNATRRGPNQRSDVNRQRDPAPDIFPAIAPDVDYDTVLAMQLAAEMGELDRQHSGGLGSSGNGSGLSDLDFDPDIHLNQLIHSYEHRFHRFQHRRLTSMEVVPASPSPPAFDDFASADEDMIPCEFCGEVFPFMALVHHQSVCDPLATSLWGFHNDSPVPIYDRNNSDDVINRRRSIPARPPAIPVINNLAPDTPAQESVSYHLNDNGDHERAPDSLESTMLPCEFCFEPFPADSLVQHQAVCEGKQSTPRVTTPAAAQPSSAFSPPAPVSQHHTFFPTTSSSSLTHPRHQNTNDPTGELLTTIHQRGQEGSSTSNSRGSGNQRPRKRPNVPRSSTTSTHTNRGGGVRGPESSTSQSQHGMTFSPHSRETPNDSQDVSIHNRRGSRQNQGHQDSASRTRNTLNSLLNADGLENQGPPRNGPSRNGPSHSRQQQGVAVGTDVLWESESFAVNRVDMFDSWVSLETAINTSLFFSALANRSQRRSSSNNAGGLSDFGPLSGTNSTTVQQQMQHQDRRQRPSDLGPPSGVNSTTVQQQMQHQDRRQRPSDLGPPSGVNSTAVQQQGRRQRPRGDSGTGEEANRRPQRERGDHVFNSSGNTRPPPSRPRRFPSDRQPNPWD